MEQRKLKSFLTKLHCYSLQPTTGMKILLQIFFWKCSGRERCSETLEILKKNPIMPQAPV